MSRMVAWMILRKPPSEELRSEGSNYVSRRIPMRPRGFPCCITLRLNQFDWLDLASLAVGCVHDSVGTAHCKRMACVQKSNKDVIMRESKIFESGGFVVTTERFIYGSKVIPLDDIRHALPFVNKGWAGMFIIAGIGMGMLMWGGAGWKIIGLLCLPGAYYFFQYTIDCALLLSMNVGESMNIKVSTTELLTNLVAAINNGIRDRQNSRAEALRDELSGLPSA